MAFKKVIITSGLVAIFTFVAPLSQAYEVTIADAKSSKICEVAVKGSTTGTAVSIDFVAPDNSKTRLVTNLIPDNAGMYSWSGIVPNTPSFKAGSQVVVYTNRLQNASMKLAECIELKGIARVE